ncbi:MAG: PKD domain-containing protein [Candidatus Helarchaeota archaeon]
MPLLILCNRKFWKKFLLVLLIMISPLSIFYYGSFRSYAADNPVHIHLTWQNSTSTTITITWQTTAADSGDIVLYDNVSRGGNPGNYRYNATGYNFTYSGASGYIHVVELANLIPDTTYYFICGGDTGGYSNERSFRTAPSGATDIRFVVGGDSRNQQTEREKISQAMAKFNPAFVLHSGDMVNDGTIQSLWDTWFSDVDSNWISNENMTIPIIPAIGNHEGNSINYYSQFALPGNEMWYSYDWGPDIHIIVLSTETSTAGAQKAWLESDLINHSTYKWKFVMFHQPPFPATRPSGHAGVLTDWVPLFDKYHVDIVFSGHDHAYLRTQPINWTASQTQAQLYSNGTMYVISGGWGAPLYSLNTHWYDANGAEKYHFCVIDVFTNGTLHLQAVDNQGDVFDEAWIIKNESLPLPTLSVTITSQTRHNSLPIEITWNSTGIIDHFKIYIDGQFKKYLASVIKSYQITDLQEGNHTIEIVAFDPLGNSVNTSEEIIYDLTPPNTTNDYDGLWHNSDFTINLTANDNLSGIAATYYRINDGVTFNLSANGQPVITYESADNKLEYWSVDLANNEENPHHILTGIKLDKTLPIANAGSNQTIEIGAEYEFNANKSADNIAIREYRWSFIDIVPKTYTNISFYYTFSAIGIYKVTLKVSDFAGWWDTDIIWINVTDSTAPVANFSSVQKALIWTSIEFDARNSTDNVEIISYIWDFGDGTILTTTNPVVTHVYSTPGTYQVKLTVTDTVNNTATTSFTIIIEDVQWAFPLWIIEGLGIEIGVIIVLIVLEYKMDFLLKRKKCCQLKENTFNHLSEAQ